MKYKRIMLVALMLLAIIAIGGVSAAEENATSDELASGEDLNIESSINETELSAGDNTELVSLIEQTSEGGNLILEKDYTYIDAPSNGITINKQITIDGQGHTIDANSSSRIFTLDERVTLKNIIFKNAKTDHEGGALYFYDQTLICTNCTFINCIGSWGGGAIYGTYGTISDSNFINCTTSDTGGAIQWQYTNRGSVINCTFTNCSANSGGATYCGAYYDNNTYINCHASYRGGGSYWYDYSGNDLRRSKYINCYADSGGAIYVKYDDFYISDCYFENCHATYGGVLYSESYGKLENNSISNCYAENGGVIYSLSLDTIENNNNITNCSAEMGSIYYMTEDSKTIYSSISNFKHNLPSKVYTDEKYNVTFELDQWCNGIIVLTIDGESRNTSVTNGRATMELFNYGNISGNSERVDMNLKYIADDVVKYCEDYKLNIGLRGYGSEIDIIELIRDAKSGSTIYLDAEYELYNVDEGITVGKSITIDGQGHTIDAKSASRIFYVENEHVTFKNIIFLNGYEYDDRGGAIYSDYEYTTIDNCTFINCRSRNSGGGAVYYYESNSIIENSRFIGCSAYQGGAAWVYYHSNKIINSTFENCTARDDCGALGCGNAINCTFINCYSGNSGGAKKYGYASNCTFINCSAKNNGGATYSITSCTNCNFTDCYAGDKAGAMNDGTAKNCIFTNCTSKNGYALNEGTCDGCTFNNCSAGLDSGIYIYIPSELNPGTNITIGIGVSSKYNGTLTAFVNNVSYQITKESDSYYTLELKNVSCGDYTVKVQSEATDLYDAGEEIEAFKIYYDPELVVDAPDIFIGDDALIRISINESITGDFILKFDGENYPYTLDHGTCLLTIPGLSVGSHYISADFKGDNKFKDAKKTAYFYVNYYEPNIEIIADSISEGQDAQVTISLNSTASGTVTVYVNGEVYPAVFNNNIATFTLTNLTRGNYPIRVIYTDNVKFASRDITQRLSVTSNPENVSLNTLISQIGYNGVLTLTKDYNITQTISIDNKITIDGKNHVLDANSQRRIFTLNDEATLKNIIFKNGKTSGDGGAIHTYDKLTCINCTFINCKSGDWGGAIKGDSGSIIDCKFINCTTPNEGGAIYWPGSSGNVYNSVFINCVADYGAAIYSGNLVQNSTFIACNARYNQIVSSSKVYDCKFTNSTIPKSKIVSESQDVVNCTFIGNLNPSLSITANDIKEGQNQTVTIYISSYATGNVTVTVNNIAQPTTRYLGGNYVVTLNNLTQGIYTVVASFAGDESYSAAQATKTFVVKPGEEGTATPQINIALPDNVCSGGSVKVSLPTNAKGNVILTIAGNDYSFDIENGEANVIMPELNDGTYDYTIKYTGDSYYAPITRSGNLIINNTQNKPVENNTNTQNNTTEPSNLVDAKIVAGNMNAVYTSNSFYTITVYGNDGKVAKGASVTIKVNGKSFKTLPTDANGIAKFKVTQIPGTYKIQATSLGKTVTKTLTVKHVVTLKNINVKKSAKKLVITITLAKVNGKYLKGKKITFKFNGKTYKPKTNSKGVAKVTIPSKVLKKLKVGKKVTYQATYLKDTVKKSVKVKK